MQDHTYDWSNRGRGRGRGQGQQRPSSRSSSVSAPANIPFLNSIEPSLMLPPQAQQIRQLRRPRASSLHNATPSVHTMNLRRTGTVAPAPPPMQQSSSADQNRPVQRDNVRSPTHLNLNDPQLQAQFGVSASDLAREMNSPFPDNSCTMYRTVSEADISDIQHGT